MFTLEECIAHEDANFFEKPKMLKPGGPSPSVEWGVLLWGQSCTVFEIYGG